MKYLSEYRDKALIDTLLEKIRARLSQPRVLMEVCGGQTHSIVKYALDQLLPQELELVHGPGCPVCVTAPETIEQAIAIARRPDVIFCSFGDMLRVPGHRQSLQDVRAEGADIRMLYSPLDALAIARENPQQKIVFFAVGFETTAPATAMAIAQAKQQGLKNFYLLLSHFLVPPAMSAILDSPANRVQGFLAPGHVCAITGIDAYRELAERYRVPIVITGFEPADILLGILHCIDQLERDEAAVDNQYPRVVNNDGNLKAREIIDTVFEITDQSWRGIGTLANSGLQLSPAWRTFDAAPLARANDRDQRPCNDCISGEILRGLKKPTQCPHFGNSCHPEHPLGAPMVSSEGACAAYFHYQ